MAEAYSEARIERVQLGVQKSFIRRPSLADAADCLRSARPAEAATNFERPFTPLPPLRSPRNFGNAFFRRFATFDFLTPKTFFRKIFQNFFVFHHFRSIFEELGFF